MLIREFRVIMPLTVQEYQIAQLYSVAECSKENSGGGEGVEVVKNEPYTNFPLLGGKYCAGQYTYKIYHLASKVPTFVRLLAPAGSLEIHEEAWNAYPYCRTILTNPAYMKEKFYIIIDTLHVNDRGHQDNVHELPDKTLKERQVVFIDILNDPIPASDRKEDQDPSMFKSQKSGRGPLIGTSWKDEVEPVMTCYKLVTAEFKWFGLQARIENVIQKSERRLFINFHRQMFCSMDKWYGLTMQDIRAIEDETKKELEELRQKGEVRGLKADSD